MIFDSDLPPKLARFLDRLPKVVLRRVERLISDPQNFHTLGLWISAVVAALVSVAYAQLFHLAELGFRYVMGKSPYLPFLLSPALFLIAWWVVRRFAPEAAGSGIPQIMAANEADYDGPEKTLVDRLLSLRTAAVKVVSSLLCALGGGAIGREGPTLQISTSVFHFFGKQVRRFAPNVSEHVWVVAGAASGLASAFNTPLGGIVYAIEELGLVHFHKVRTALLSGVIVSGLVAQWILGSYLYLGFPKLAAAGWSTIPMAIGSGVISGMLGAFFGSMLYFLLRKRLAIRNPGRLALLTVGCGLLVAGLAWLQPKSSGSGVEVISGILFSKAEPDVFLVASRIMGTVFSYLSGAAGGIFSPSLAIGASVGQYLTEFFGADQPNLMTLLGMIGFLTGVTRTPFTSFILVLEMTDRHSAIFPMMLAAVSAHWISRLVDGRSFYEHVKMLYKPPANH